MKTTRIQDAAGYDPARVVARPLLDGDQCNVRIIRLSPGQVLPPHRHGRSDLMLFVVEGQGELETADGTQPFDAGALAFYRGDEELRVRNAGGEGMTMLAFLSPTFPPAG
jgi:quercetin dioxygenase-like cupin family protein